MKNFITKIKSIFSIKNVSYPLLLLNLLNIIIGIIYIVLSVPTLIWTIFGILLLITFFGNFLLVYITSININNRTMIGNRINLLCYFYSVFTIISVFLILFGNFFISVNYSNSILANFGFYLMVFSGYFGVLSFGAILSYFNIRNLKNRKLWEIKPQSSISASKSMVLFKKILKIILGALCIISFIGGIYLSYAITISSLTNYIIWLTGMLIFQFYLFIALIMLSTTILFLKLINQNKWKKLRYAIGILGLFLVSIFLLPLLSTPLISMQAENDFAQAFGAYWKSEIEVTTETYFMNTPFSVIEYFLGNSPKSCNIDENITFYIGEGITLCYDAYYLESGGNDLPGNNSVIIKIHGGAWVAGDKGMANMLQFNKYFAAQGYVVFDIQYGLKDSGRSWIPTPNYVKGNFTIDDQVRHIGEFIKLLNNTEFSKYNPNLDSVFITGNSAGGHLSMATALLTDNGNYTSLFGTNLKIKGIIPLYPGNPTEQTIGGTDLFRNPEDYFIDIDSPPCLIFQGTKDFCLYESQHIKQRYQKAGNDNCCIIFFPFQGHANDLYYSGHFNQYLIYYTERFLYLCVNDKIV